LAQGSKPELKDKSIVFGSMASNGLSESCPLKNDDEPAAQNRSQQSVLVRNAEAAPAFCLLHAARGAKQTLKKTMKMRIAILASCSVAAVFVAGGVHGIGTWAALTTHASVAAPAPLGIDPFQMMVTAKDLPTQQEVDRRLEQMNPWRCDSACARVVQDYFTNSNS
jgi:hypothetical protein